MIYDPSQLSAIESASNLKNRISLVTGGAGSGKTTVIKSILDKLGDCELMSPTGKAAARMAEVTGRDASTIHRALGFNGEIWMRKKWFDKPVIIDEASMIDSMLMAKILDYKPQKLILVGDDSQLEPVGRGCPFKDLIRIIPESVSRLTVCHRAKGAIHKASQAIRAGQAPLMSDQADGESFKMINTGDATATTAKLLKWVTDGYYKPETDMILSPRYGAGSEENDGGIDSLNREIKAIINPSLGKLAVKDRIIVTKNHADIGPSGIWNGDLGFITDIDSAGRPEITLDRDKKNNGDDPVLIQIGKDEVKDIRLAYAMSVHKAQGSEAEHVFVIVLKNHFYQLNRSLIYTAVTRAKKATVVMGQMSAFYQGINKTSEKKTILQYLGRNKKHVSSIL